MKEVQGGAEGGSLDAGTEAEAREDHCLVTSCPKMALPSVRWALWGNLMEVFYQLLLLFPDNYSLCPTDKKKKKKKLVRTPLPLE